MHLGLASLQQFEESGLSAITQPALMPLDNAGVPTWPISKPRCDLREQLADDLLIGETGQSGPAGMQPTLLGDRDEFLDETAGFLGLLDRRDDPFMRNQRSCQVTHQGHAMRGIPSEFPSCF